jgi:hypothetical protein
MSNPSGKFSAPAPLVALAGWLIPGAGYWLIGHRLRGSVVGVTIIILFVFGILLGGIRVIDVPGYDDQGYAPYVRYERRRPPPNRNVAPQDLPVREYKTIHPTDEAASDDWQPVSDWKWTLRAHLLPEVANKPWFVGQILSGPICLLAAYVSLDASHPISPGGAVSAIPRSHARIAEIGTLYTAVAGMLNLLAIIDAAYRAGQGAR